MAPCLSAGADSMRQASIAMSCVAAKNATPSANTAMRATLSRRIAEREIRQAQRHADLRQQHPRTAPA